jgi:SAM-dependent methyltransferase
MYRRLFSERARYADGDGYDAHRYWADRFGKYGSSLRGPGEEGLSEAENEQFYAEDRKIFTEQCRKLHVDLAAARVLEIGCGTGFYTSALKDLGVRTYCGIDITDVLFRGLRQQFPKFAFRQLDVTKDEIADEFDLVVMISVIQHIVNKQKLQFALENVQRAVAPGGRFLFCPIYPRSQRQLFFLHTWSLGDVMPSFPNWHTEGIVPFRHGEMVALRKPAEGMLETS